MASGNILDESQFNMSTFEAEGTRQDLDDIDQDLERKMRLMKEKQAKSCLILLGIVAIGLGFAIGSSHGLNSLPKNHKILDGA
jgi:hypothetical protein